MAAGDVFLICYFNGKLTDEDKNAKYTGGGRKAGTVPKSTSFVKFKEKIQEIINLPPNGMDIKIKCGVRFDQSTLIGIDVNDDDSLRFVMDHSKFIMAYILEDGPRVTEHYEVISDDISEPDENHQDYMGRRVDASSLQIVSQPSNEMLGLVGWEDMDINMYSLPNGDQHDEGINLSICNHGYSGVNDLNLNANYVEHQVAYPMEERKPPSDNDVHVGTSEHEPAYLEFKDVGVCLGSEFPNIDALRNTLSDMAVMTGHKYRHVRTSPFNLIMKCRSEACDWRIQAISLSHSLPFTVVKYRDVHTCMISRSDDKDHPQATVRWILSKVQSDIEKNPDMEPTKIIKDIKNRYGICISYNKAVKAKTKALEVMRHQLKDSHPLPRPDLCRALKEELECGGSICKLGLTPDGSSFQHLFWAFPACVKALHNHLRPVVYVGMENTPIGVLMYARSVDGNGFHGDPIEVGFALYITLDDKARGFLSWLKEFVLPPPSPLFTIVTDYNETITHAVQSVLPHVHYFLISEGIAGFVSRKFKSTRLSSYCRSACESCSIKEHEKYLQQIKRVNGTAHEWLLESLGPRSHWAVAFSPNKHVCARGLVCHHSDFDELIQGKSIFDMVKSSRDIVVNYFSKRVSKGAEATKTMNLTTGVMEDIERAKCSNYKIESISGHRYEVSRQVEREVEVVDLEERSAEVSIQVEKEAEVVDLEERSCTCCKFQATDYPCLHALRTIVDNNLDTRNYIHWWFTLEVYIATYAGTLPPPLSKQLQTAFNERHLPPLKRARVGRPKRYDESRQIKNI